jgi:hypothetical protein
LLAALTSSELALPAGTREALDACLVQLPRESVILQAVGLLNALSADRQARYRTVNGRYVKAARNAKIEVGALQVSLQDPDDVFLEPFQQLTLLRRAFAVCKESGSTPLHSTAGMQLYFDASRYASDVTRVVAGAAAVDGSLQTWLEIATGMMPRLWLGQVPNANDWLARTVLMLEEPTEPSIAARAEKLKKRFEEAVGLSQQDVSVLTLFLSYWAGVRTVDEIYDDPDVIRLDPDTWLRKTDIPSASLDTFFGRTARSWNEVLDDKDCGGPLSHLPFRDRPFIRFSNGSVAAVCADLVMEKLTGDLFWWLKAPDVPQREMWQADWGYLVEDYALRALSRIALGSGCNLQSRIPLPSGEIDAAIRHKGHVALVEITSSPIPDAAVHSGAFDELKKGLKHAFVERPQAGKPPYKEAVAQLARDIHALFAGEVPGLASASDLLRVYPVVIALDKKIRTPGVWRYLDAELRAALSADQQVKVAALAVLALEDLEEVDQAVRERAGAIRGTPPGFLRLLRRWDIDRGPVAPSWWQYVDLCYPTFRRNQILATEGRKISESLKSRFVDKT